MIRRLIIISLIPICLLVNCEETQEPNIDANDPSLLVVEALITNENKRHEVRLTQTFSGLANSPKMISNALVALNDGDNTIILQQHPERPGIYLTDTLRALIGKLYTLFIVHEEKEYFAIAASAFGAPLEPLVVVESDNDMIEYVYQESSSPSMMEVQVRWDEAGESGIPIAKEIRAFFYTLNVIDVNQIFAPDKEKVVFPKGAQLRRIKYSLTENHQEFLRSFLSEVDWRGGSFDVAPGNVRTNLSEGAIGFFAVSMTLSDMTIIN